MILIAIEISLFQNHEIVCKSNEQKVSICKIIISFVHAFFFFIEIIRAKTDWKQQQWWLEIDESALTYWVFKLKIQCKRQSKTEKKWRKENWTKTKIVTFLHFISFFFHIFSHFRIINFIFVSFFFSIYFSFRLQKVLFLLCKCRVKFVPFSSINMPTMAYRKFSFSSSAVSFFRSSKVLVHSYLTRHPDDYMLHRAIAIIFDVNVRRTKTKKKRKKNSGNDMMCTTKSHDQSVGCKNTMKKNGKTNQHQPWWNDYFTK